jgi:DNA-binding NtrC family response regulator
MKQLLVVDDDRAFRDAFRELLEIEGFRVAVAGDADEALRKLRTMSFDAVVTDIVIPGDGRTVIEHVRVSQLRIPVIVISAYDAESAAIRNGAFARFIKPVTASEVVQVLRRACALGS